jgi:hypothetical protein
MGNVTALAILPEYEEIYREATTFAGRAKLVAITDNESYCLAAMTLKSIKDCLKRVDDRLEPGRKAAYASYQEWLDLIREAKAPYLDAEAHIKLQIATYQKEEEMKRRAEESHLRERARQREEERRLQEALLAEREGNHKEAEEILAEEVSIPPPVREMSVPKIEGISTTTVWKWRVTDEHKIPREYLRIDETRINGVVRAMKEATNVPGIEIYPESIVRAGTKRPFIRSSPPGGDTTAA